MKINTSIVFNLITISVILFILYIVFVSHTLKSITETFSKKDDRIVFELIISHLVIIMGLRMRI